MNNARKARGLIVTVFGSSRPREGESPYAMAYELGAALARRGFLLCSGGYGGVMEAASRGAKEAGGRTLAVTAQFFPARANRWVDEEIRVKSWQARLFELVRRGSGYVACPGGTGTLVELAVVWEMLRKNVMPEKPFVALSDFWQPIIERVRQGEAHPHSSGGEATAAIIHLLPRPADAAEFLAEKLSPVAKLGASQAGPQPPGAARSPA